MHYSNSTQCCKQKLDSLLACFLGSTKLILPQAQCNTFPPCTPFLCALSECIVFNCLSVEFTLVHVFTRAAGFHMTCHAVFMWKLFLQTGQLYSLTFTWPLTCPRYAALSKHLLHIAEENFASSTTPLVQRSNPASDTAYSDLIWCS